MLGRREVLVLMLIAAVGLAYTASWLHHRTIPVKGYSKSVELRTASFEVNASDLSCVMGNVTPVGYYLDDLRSDLYVRVEFTLVADRNVWCDQVDLAGRMNILVRPMNGSVSIRKVLIVLENESPASVDNLFPKSVGVLYLRTQDGKFKIMPGYIPNHTMRQVMMVKAVKPSWGAFVDTSPYLSMTIRIPEEKKGGTLPVRTRLVMRIDYLVRRGFFSSEERTLKVEVPVNYTIIDLNSCNYGC